MKKLLTVLTGLILCSHGVLLAQDLSQLDSLQLIDAVSNDTISLGDYSDDSFLVVIFTSNYCPYSRKYESRIKELHRSFKDQGVQFFLVNPNKGDNDGLEEMRQKAVQQQYDFPYLSDKEQQLTNILGASRTPEAFLIRKEGFQIIYQGAIDDNPQASEYVESSYLKTNIDQAISGQASSHKQIKVIGCMIKKGG